MKGFKAVAFIISIFLIGCGGARDGTNTSPIQRIEIQGVVRDISGFPVKKSEVEDLESGTRTITDDSGAFVIQAELNPVTLEATLAFSSSFADAVLTFDGENVSKDNFLSVVIEQSGQGDFTKKEEVILQKTPQAIADPISIPKIESKEMKENSENKDDKTSQKTKDESSNSEAPVVPEPAPTPDNSESDVTVDDVTDNDTNEEWAGGSDEFTYDTNQDSSSDSADIGNSSADNSNEDPADDIGTDSDNAGGDTENDIFGLV